MHTMPADLKDLTSRPPSRPSAASSARASSTSSLGKQLAVAACGWLAGCALAGYLVATAHGEHGALLFILLGGLLGLAGAVVHTTLLSVAGFRRCGVGRQALLLWLATLAMTFVIALAAGIDPNAAGTGVLLSEVVAVVLVYFATPALGASFGLTWLVKRTA